MNTSELTERHAKAIKGVLHGFDRLVLFGTDKSIGWPGAMGRQRGKPRYPLMRATALRSPILP